MEMNKTIPTRTLGQWKSIIRPYVDAGKRVIWLTDNKKPLVKGWNDPAKQNGTWADLEGLHNWAREKNIPIWGYGVVQGPLSQHEYTLDFDHDAQAMFQRFCEDADQKYGLKVADWYRTETGRAEGGIHLTFTTDEDLDQRIDLYNADHPKNRINKQVLARVRSGDDFVAAIEFKGQGRQVVKPHSFHRSGKEYIPKNGDGYQPQHVGIDTAMQLVQLAAGYDEKPKIQRPTAKPKVVNRTNTDGSSNFVHTPQEVKEAYNAQNSIHETLERYGYVDQGNGYFRHPWNDTADSVHLIGENGSHHFGASDKANNGGDSGTTHTPFSLFCLFDHNDEFSSAIKAVSSKYGMDGRRDSKTAPNQANAKAASTPADTQAQQDSTTTDLANAYAFVQEYGEQLHYVPQWNTWLVWDGKRWKRDIGNVRVMQMAYQFVRKNMPEQAKTINNDTERSSYLKWSSQSQSRFRIESLVSLARNIKGIPVQPTDLDGKPMLLNVRNGTLDLSTGQLLQHSKDDLLTKLADIQYDENADCPRWDSFLAEIFADRNGNPNKEIIGYVQRFAGYTLTGDVSRECFMILHGLGANGKTTFIQTLRDILGEYAAQSPDNLLMDHRQRTNQDEVADLQGVRLAACSETNEGARFNESKIKQIVSNAPITCSRKYERLFTFDPSHKIILDCNHKPRIRGSDDGIWRRVVVVPFLTTIPEDKRDFHLRKKLEKEASGILNWMLQGLEKLKTSGLSAPTDIETAVESYRTESDLFGTFLSDCTVPKQYAYIPTQTLYDTYLDWAKVNGMEHHMTQINFGRQLADRGYDHGVTRINGKITRIWKDLALRSGLDDPEDIEEDPLEFDDNQDSEVVSLDDIDLALNFDGL